VFAVPGSTPCPHCSSARSTICAAHAEIHLASGGAPLVVTVETLKSDSAVLPRMTELPLPWISWFSPTFPRGTKCWMFPCAAKTPFSRPTSRRSRRFAPHHHCAPSRWTVSGPIAMVTFSPTALSPIGLLTNEDSPRRSNPWVRHRRSRCKRLHAARTDDLGQVGVLLAHAFQHSRPSVSGQLPGRKSS